MSCSARRRPGRSSPGLHFHRRLVTQRLLTAAAALADSAGRISFGAPVAHVYNPLEYAWAVHQRYLERFATGPRKVLFLGMNPGPFGMVQTGVPFGEVAAVREWMGIEAPVAAPKGSHPKRPVDGFQCPRSEVSGRRLWGLFAQRFGSADRFFAGHFVANYCPLAFLDEGARNLTPDKFPTAETQRLFSICDAHLRELVAALKPAWLIGIGDFALRRAELALDSAIRDSQAGSPACAADRPDGPANRRPRTAPLRFGKILHPSPANPAANRDWAGAVTSQLMAMGVWSA